MGEKGGGYKGGIPMSKGNATRRKRCCPKARRPNAFPAKCEEGGMCEMGGRANHEVRKGRGQNWRTMKRDWVKANGEC